MIHCPNCGSRGVRKSKAVYEQGISTGSYRSGSTYTSSRGRVGFRSSSGTSRRISAVAERNAPPQNDLPGKVGTAVWISITVLGTISNAGFLGSLGVGFVVALIAAAITAGKTSAAFNAKLADYDRTWYCRQCGDQFLI